MIEDEAWLRRQIAALTRSQEAAAPRPGRSATRRRISSPRWSRQIVGVEIEIADMRGKWKASQNRPAADRAGVVAGLTADGDPDALAMAAIVREAAK